MSEFLYCNKSLNMSGTFIAYVGTVENSGKPQTVAYAHGSTREECDNRAELIVRAVNSHERLLEALQDYIDADEVAQLENGGIGGDIQTQAEQAVKAAKAARLEGE